MNTNSKADGDSFYHKFGLKQDDTFGKVEHILTSSAKTAEVYNTYGTSTTAKKCQSLHGIHSKNMFCPDAIKSDFVQNRVNRIFASESDEDCSLSLGSDSGRFVSNERQNLKRLFSNFTLHH